MMAPAYQLQLGQKQKTNLKLAVLFSRHVTKIMIGFVANAMENRIFHPGKKSYDLWTTWTCVKGENRW